MMAHCIFRGNKNKTYMAMLRLLESEPTVLDDAIVANLNHSY